MSLMVLAQFQTAFAADPVEMRQKSFQQRIDTLFTVVEETFDSSDYSETFRQSFFNFQTNIKTDTEEVFINQGEPLALIVPYKREEFKSNIVDLNDKNEHSIKYHKNFLKTYGTFKINFRKDYWNDK